MGSLELWDDVLLYDNAFDKCKFKWFIDQVQLQSICVDWLFTFLLTKLNTNTSNESNFVLRYFK